MIPKILHYCWFGRTPLCKEIKEYIESWKEHNPNYKVKEWNEDNFDVNKLAYTREAYALKKYAFVSDVVRLYALMTEGGIYLDTDVKVIKSFDDLLKYHSFVGRETDFLPSTAVIGAEPNQTWVKDFYDIYKYKHFVSLRGALKEVPNTQLLGSFLSDSYYRKDYLPTILDSDVLCAKYWHTGELYVTDKTIAIHNFKESWKRDKEVGRLKGILIRWMGK